MMSVSCTDLPYECFRNVVASYDLIFIFTALLTSKWSTELVQVRVTALRHTPYFWFLVLNVNRKISVCFHRCQCIMWSEGGSSSPILCLFTPGTSQWMMLDWQSCFSGSDGIFLICFGWLNHDWLRSKWACCANSFKPRQNNATAIVPRERLVLFKCLSLVSWQNT